MRICKLCQKDTNSKFSYCKNCMSVMDNDKLYRELGRQLELLNYYNKYSYSKRMEMKDYDDIVKSADLIAKVIVDKLGLPFN